VPFSPLASPVPPFPPYPKIESAPCPPRDASDVPPESKPVAPNPPGIFKSPPVAAPGTAVVPYPAVRIEPNVVFIFDTNVEPRTIA